MGDGIVFVPAAAVNLAILANGIVSIVPVDIQVVSVSRVRSQILNAQIAAPNICHDRYRPLLVKEVDLSRVIARRTLAADKTDILADRPVRSRRKSTDLLVEFVDEYLPSRGLHAGTEDCSWARAMGLFMDRYPDAKSYGTPRNFADCYRKAKKRREDTPQNRSDTN